MPDKALLALAARSHRRLTRDALMAPRQRGLVPGTADDGIYRTTTVL